jgi:hypothetical protein
MNQRGAIIVGTAVLPLVAVIVCFFCRGGFEKMTDAPRVFAGLLSAIALLSMAWKPKVGTRPRAVSSFLLHHKYLETKYLRGAGACPSRRSARPSA